MVKGWVKEFYFYLITPYMRPAGKIRSQQVMGGQFIRVMTSTRVILMNGSVQG
jgi:hypothetical protein